MAFFGSGYVVPGQVTHFNKGSHAQYNYPKSLSKSLCEPIQNQTTVSPFRSARARKESLMRTDQMLS